MFEKKRVAFSRKEIFGNNFKPVIDICFCRVSRMVYDDKFMIPDGTIDITKAAAFKKDELWSYIYYLYYYNQSNVLIFENMKDQENGKASAELFYNTVIAFVDGEKENAVVDESKVAPPFDVSTLIMFINTIIEDFGKELINPIFDYLKLLVNKSMLARISGITLKANSGTSGNTGNSYSKIKIVTDEQNVKNANVKISFSVQDEAGKKDAKKNVNSQKVESTNVTKNVTKK